jgi:sugar O-acyltransferase (sialic acid O-acetyltransferase NeuD family)
MMISSCKKPLEESVHSSEQSSLRPLVILGVGGHAVSVANVALSAGYKIKCFIDKKKKGSNLFGYGIIGELRELQQIDQYSFAIAVGDNAVRERIYKELLAIKPSLHFPALVHSSAVISSFTTIEDGVVVMPSVVIGPNSRVGKFCFLNTRASLDHDCVMFDYSSLAPAVATGGGVSIGQRSAISIGATVKQGIKIGDDCVIGANSYLNKDLPSNQVAYGIPAKQVRIRNIGDDYLN